MLHSPAGQFALVQSSPEIFYCLPTFVDRSLRAHALEHCLFWRPGSTTNYNVWYDNPLAHTPYKSVRGEMRWGHFVEALMSCSVGLKAATPPEAKAHVHRIYHRAQEHLRRPQADVGPQPEGDTGLYVLVLKLPD
jgi:hypothetical protein